MSSASVKEFGKAWWSEVYNRIIGAVVFIDDASAECLHWDGGLFNLLSGGAVAVKSLSPFEVSILYVLLFSLNYFVILIGTVLVLYLS